MENLPIDMIQITASTYRRLWGERFYLIQLGFLPFMVAWLNFVVVNVVDPDVTLLRRGLWMLPSVLAEGWLVAQFLRTVLVGERWPMVAPRPLPRPVPASIMGRIRGVLGGIILYTLCSLMISAAVGGLFTIFPELLATPTEQAVVPLGGSSIALAFLVFSVFQFRLFFLHVPMIVNGSFVTYLSMTHRPIINVQMVGVWMAVQVPLLAVIFILLQPLIAIGQGDSILSFAIFLIVSGFSVIGQMLLAILGSTAIAQVITPRLFHRNKN